MVEYIRSLHFTEDDIAFLRAQGIFDEGFLDYLRHFRFTGDLYALREGTVMYPNTPVVTVVAPLIEAQIVETAILLEINHQSLIATKANRIVRAAQGRVVSDFGAAAPTTSTPPSTARAPPTSAAWIPPPRCWPGRCSISPFPGRWRTRG